ncbi:MAG TPA: universal stress protein [Steroidobacteraceae bacterium]
MRRLDRILAVVDPTVETQSAVAKAACLARASGATLELFICDFDPALSGRPFADTAAVRMLREEFLDERGEYLEDLADELRAGGLNVETHVHWDNPLHRGILARIRESAPDLVVKDTHFHSLLRRTLFTNTDWNLIRTSPAPLLLAKSAGWPAHPRLLAAVDPGHLADKPAALDHDILDFAALLAQFVDGEVDAVHAFFPAALLALTTGMGGLPLGGETAVDEIVAAERGRIEEGVRKLAAAHSLPAGRVHLVQGSAAEALPRAVVDLRADLVLMGAVSRSRLEELFIGSTAERVLDRLPVDVLVVKAPDFAEQMPP